MIWNLWPDSATCSQAIGVNTWLTSGRTNQVLSPFRLHPLPDNMFPEEEWRSRTRFAPFRR
jgi:hypothetical protein